MIDAAERQQLPTGDGEDVAKRVADALCLNAYAATLIPDIEARVTAGEKKYGMRLKTNNGRNVDLDLYQEILDSLNYSMQAWMQTGNYEYKDIFNLETALALRVKALLSARTRP